MKKIVFLVLVFAVIFLVVGCGEKSTDNKPAEDAGLGDAENPEKAADGGESDELAELVDSYELPVMDFAGHEFNILGHIGETGGEVWQSREIAAEAMDGNLLNDAVYSRNRQIEEKYNVKISGIYKAWFGGMLGDVKKMVGAGDSYYDAVMLNFEDASKASQAGYLTDLKAVPHIDLSMPWWAQNLVGETSVMGRLYYCAGDMTLLAREGTWTMMFNKKMLGDYGLENPYEIVKSGNWTTDKFIEMSKGVSKDLNGDQKWDEGDQYGFATTFDSVRGLFYSCGLRILAKDADDTLRFTLGQDNRAVGVFEKIYEIMRGPDNITMIMEDFGVGDGSNIQAAFEQGRALFYGEVMQCVIRLRQTETEFGILPFPKADAKQGMYYTNVHRFASSTVAIPVSVDNMERSGLIMEALAHGSKKYVQPAYYERALKSKFLRDDESSEMLDILFAGQSADLGDINNVGGLMTDFVSNVSKKNPDFASTIEKKAGKIQSDLDKIVAAYAGIG